MRDVVFEAAEQADEGREFGKWELTCRTPNDLYLVREWLSREESEAWAAALNEICARERERAA